MYNDEPYEQFQKGKSVFIKLFVLACIICALVAIFFTGCKQESFVCSKKQNLCYVEKTNLLNMKTKKKFIKISEINKVTYMRQKVRGNRFAIGYTSFILVVEDSKNNPHRVFSTSYFEKKEIDDAVLSLKKQLKNNTDEITLNRY